MLPPSQMEIYHPGCLVKSVGCKIRKRGLYTCNEPSLLQIKKTKLRGLRTMDITNFLLTNGDISSQKSFSQNWLIYTVKKAIPLF
jgi:hypothetical protein